MTQAPHIRPTLIILLVAVLAVGGVGIFLLTRDNSTPPSTSVAVTATNESPVNEVTTNTVPEYDPNEILVPETNTAPVELLDYSVPENWTSADDHDGDGLKAFREFHYGTSDEDRDSDDDEYADMDEILNQYNPTGPGNMDADYFVHTHCPNVWQQAICNNYTQETKDQVKRLCPPWGEMAAEYCDIYRSYDLEHIDSTTYNQLSSQILTTSESACDETKAILDDGLRDYLQNIGVTIRDDAVCTTMLQTAQYMCNLQYILDNT